MTDYTPLDSRKQCSAQANYTLEQIIAVVNEIPNLSSPMVIHDAAEFAAHQLSELRALITDSVAAHAEDDTLTYGDGRDVVSMVDVGDSRPYTHVWRANPNAPDNQPGPVSGADVVVVGVTHQLVIMAPGVIVPIEVPEI
jgi:hypothetical protein